MSIVEMPYRSSKYERSFVSTVMGLNAHPYILATSLMRMENGDAGRSALKKCKAMYLGQWEKWYRLARICSRLPMEIAEKLSADSARELADKLEDTFTQDHLKVAKKFVDALA